MRRFQATRFTTSLRKQSAPTSPLPSLQRSDSKAAPEFKQSSRRWTLFPTLQAGRSANRGERRENNWGHPLAVRCQVSFLYKGAQGFILRTRTHRAKSAQDKALHTRRATAGHPPKGLPPGRVGFYPDADERRVPEPHSLIGTGFVP